MTCKWIAFVAAVGVPALVCLDLMWKRIAWIAFVTNGELIAVHRVW